MVTWIGPADQNYLSVASGGKLLVASFDASAGGLIKPTIVRTRGEVSYRLNASNADVSISGAYGLAVVTDRAFAAGVASIPGPFTDATWDGWFVWRSFSMSFDSIDQTGVFFKDRTQEVDSKAMRKVNDDETIVLVAESQSGAFDIAMQPRLLLKLS